LTTGPDSFFAWVNAPASDDPLKESATRIATLAQIAIASGNFDAFRRCIRENAFDLNAGYSPHRWTLLHQLAGLGKKTLPVHARMAEDLLSAGADVNCKTVLGWTPLHLIAMQGQAQAVELAKVLIAHRPDLMAVDDQGLGWKDNWQHGKEIYDLLEDARSARSAAFAATAETSTP
jgi:ankyrin repeat protein